MRISSRSRVGCCRQWPADCRSRSRQVLALPVIGVLGPTTANCRLFRLSPFKQINCRHNGFIGDSCQRPIRQRLAGGIGRSERQTPSRTAGPSPSLVPSPLRHRPRSLRSAHGSPPPGACSDADLTMRSRPCPISLIVSVALSGLHQIAQQIRSHR